MTPKDEMRVLGALVIQPLVAGLAAFVLFPLLDGRVEGALPMAMGTGLAAVFVTLLGALPAIAWHWGRPVTFLKTALAGAILGTTPGLVLMLLIALHGDARAANGGVTSLVRDLSRALGFGTIIGLVCSTVFWLLAGRRLTTAVKA